MSAVADSLQRSSGTVRLAFKRDGSRTALDTLYQDGCYKVRFPRAIRHRPAEAILINTSGGLTDGDSLSCLATWLPDTTALLTTQAAERIYRSRDAAATILTRLDIGDRAAACWLPQETIFFDGGRLDRATEVSMRVDSTLFAAESLVFGRSGMGEITRRGRLSDRWRVRIDGKLIFADGLLFDDVHRGRLAEEFAHRAIANGAHCMSTLVYVAHDCASRLDAFRDALRDGAVVGGASHLGPLIVARILSTSGSALRDAVARVFAATQHGPADRQFSMPRVWHC